ncbi:MAG: sulfatase [Candidatus Solibacter sp.]|nr:sulfatase [Candidatus Solibacter sp.]
MLGLAHRGFAMTDYRRHILYTLRDAGYRTILGGLQHIAAKPETIGYDDLRRAKSNRVADVAPAARFLNSRPTEPFFLDVGFFETHRAYPAPTADDDPRYIQPPVPMPDTAATRADMAGFHASARILDQGVGHVLDALERSGLGANTLVISTTDHGLAFPDMKCNLLDSGFGVSLIMRGPGVRGGKAIDAMVSQLDLFPTICDMLELKHPAWLEGKSMLPLLRGETQQLHDEIFARGQLPRRLPTEARRPHAALEVHPPLQRDAHARAAQLRRWPKQKPLARVRLADSARSASLPTWHLSSPICARASIRGCIAPMIRS